MVVIHYPHCTPHSAMQWECLSLSSPAPEAGTVGMAAFLLHCFTLVFN